MGRQLTRQEQVDAQTLKLENPNVVGSGFIQFPPQVPFAKPVQVQPPTVAHLDHPEEFARQHRLPQRQQQHPRPQSQPRHTNVQGQPQGQPLHGRSGPGGQRASGTYRSVPQQQQNGWTGPARPMSNSMQHPRVAQPVPQSATQRPENAKQATATSMQQVGNGSIRDVGTSDDSKLSKSQAKRLRKKLRETGQ